MLDSFIYHFSTSGVETYIFLPSLVMFLVSVFTSTAGVSGAFILLPFQMSVLGYTAPGVSATNFVYNIVSIPLGAFRYVRGKRLSYILLFLLTFGTVPGVFLGYCIRILYLPNPQNFKIFVGFVLAYLGIRTLQSAIKELSGKLPEIISTGRSLKVEQEKLGLFQGKIFFQGKAHNFSPMAVFVPALATGIIGGAYGIGGGAIMVPYCISVLELPVYIVAGAALISTWIASVISALFYAFGPLSQRVPASPDWLLGALFGIGGAGGIYAGSILQKIIPPKVIKLILGLAVVFISVKYLWLLK